MAFSREAYRALENCVGPDNISDDPVICDTYAYQYLAEFIRADHTDHFMPRPVAAILPGSTEEVQAIVKVCNRYKIKVKPYSTGWYFYGAPQKDGVDTVQLDLRRMDRILELDEKNMLAVVEPYVICGTLQAEAMKVGLNLNIIGAGASTSPLASTTSYLGVGANSLRMGNNFDNMLALEWVMPNGEILKTGSAGYGAGWFCSEGPGPSMRALSRSSSLAAKGSMGVYTKVAIRLSYWPGPKELPIEGRPPAYHSPLPNTMRAYTLAFPSWEAYARSYRLIYENQIGYVAHRQFNKLGGELAPAFWFLYNDPTRTLSDISEIANNPEIKKLTEELRISYQICLGGLSLRDIVFQDKVLDQILAETGGWKVASLSEKDMAEFTHLYMNRLGHKALNFVYNGGYIGGYSIVISPEQLIRMQPIAEKQMQEDQASGLLVQCGGDSMMGRVCGSGDGTDCCFEQFCFYDPASEKSVEAAVSHMQRATKTLNKNGFPAGKEVDYLRAMIPEEELWKIYLQSGPASGFHIQRKIKELIDPNDLGDRYFETIPEAIKE
jgi:hypothetical protein